MSSQCAVFSQAHCSSEPVVRKIELFSYFLGIQTIMLSAPSPRRMRKAVSRLGVSTLHSIQLKWLRSTRVDRASWISVLPWRSRIERMAEPNGKDNRFGLRVER
jgi:hypothetical protein